MKNWIYFDNNATTPIDLEVVGEIVIELSLSPANPSSAHYFGQMAKARLSSARYKIAKSLKVLPEEIIFNSGATEGLNSLIRKYLEDNPRAEVISSSIEHSCIYKTLSQLKKKGFDVRFLNPNKQGFISKRQLESEITNKTGLVVLGSANSETGVKNEISSISQMLSEKGIFFIVDAVALFSKDTLIIPKGVSAMAFSAHKFHGPQGVGFLFKKKSLHIEPFITGGEQEFSNRAGTENLIGIIGLAKAVEIAQEKLPHFVKQMNLLRQKFEDTITKNLEGVYINGEGERVSNTSNLAFDGIDGESLLINLDMAKIAVSHGSACSSGAIEPSRVLLNMGLSYKMAKSSLRFSFSKMNTIDEVEKACEVIISQVKQLRSL